MSPKADAAIEDLLQVLKDRCGRWKSTGSWVDAPPLGVDEVPNWAKLPVEYQKRSAETLELWRYITLRCQAGNGDRPPCEKLLKKIWPYVVAWINFLLKPPTETHYFEEIRSLDETFYQGPKNLEPKPIANSTENAFPLGIWLKHPERLTIAELELALAIFQWNEPNPQLVWWVKERPYLLHKIHRFLLQRYCFPLLSALRQARKTAGLDSPPYRAVEWERINPRLTGFVAIGTLAVIGLDFLPAFFFAGFYANRPVALASVFLFYILIELAYVDIFKQNRPLLVTRRHASCRVRRLFLEVLGRSAVLSALMIAFWTAAERILQSRENLNRVFNTARDSWNLSNLVWPYLLGRLENTWPLEVWRLLTGFIAMVASAAVLGFLLQGFWEDTSALEPI
jgi:hypothetical protein